MRPSPLIVKESNRVSVNLIRASLIKPRFWLPTIAGAYSRREIMVRE